MNGTDKSCLGFDFTSGDSVPFYVVFDLTSRKGGSDSVLTIGSSNYCTVGRRKWKPHREPLKAAVQIRLQLPGGEIIQL